MADSIVGGLFGVSPEQLMQQRQARDVEQQMAVGRSAAMPGSMMSPSLAPFYQQATQQGQLIGRGVGALLGAQDPELQRITQIQQLSSQFDLTSAEGMREFARSLQQIAPQEAMMAAKRADEIESAMGTRALNLRKAQAEGTSTEWIGVPGKPELKQQAIVNRITGETTPVGAPISVFSSKTDVKVDARTQGPKNVLDIDKKDAENLIKVRDSSENIIPRLEEQAAALQKGIAAGSFSDARVAFSTALNTLGLGNKTTLNMLKNTKTFNANRIELAASVAKQLGVNPTDRDFQASLDRFAGAGDAPEASAQFINDMLMIQRKRLADANQGLSYYREKQGSFEGYNRPLPSSPVVSADPFAGKTLDQLKQMRDEARKKNK